MRTLARFACAVTLPVFFATAASAALVSVDSPFGADTITLDTETGLRWLDLTLSSDLTHEETLQAIAPGGTFEGYRLATREELGELLANAGFDLSAGTAGNFVPQNFDPAVALAALIGTLGTNGNCGAGCTFSFTNGWLGSPPVIQDTFATGSIAWFDNSAGQDPDSPQAPVGRYILEGGGGLDFSDPGTGAWLVLIPEPGTLLLLGAGLAGLVAFGRARGA